MISKISDIQLKNPRNPHNRSQQPSINAIATLIIHIQYSIGPAQSLCPMLLRLFPLVNLQPPYKLPCHHPRNLLRIVRHPHIVLLVWRLALVLLGAIRRRRIRIPRILCFDAVSVGASGRAGVGTRGGVVRDVC